MKVMGGNPSLTYGKGEIKLPNDIDPEIREELIEAGYDLSVKIKKNSGMIQAQFHYCKNNANKAGNSDYRDFDKTFPSWKEHNDFCDKFFAIAEDKVEISKN